MTQDELKSLLNYDPETGVFTWVKSSGRAKSGDVAGRISHGYRRIPVNGKCHMAHRLAWLIMVGEEPEHEIDHANGDKLDNRFSNLRAATRKQNATNRGAMKNSKTGIKNVCYIAWRKKYKVQMKIGDKVKHIGYFDCLELAALVASEHRAKLHGEFARAT